jgi:hypothetical protein
MSIDRSLALINTRFYVTLLLIALAGIGKLGTLAVADAAVVVSPSVLVKQATGERVLVCDAERTATARSIRGA